MANTHSSLLSLPPELRNSIWNLVLKPSVMWVYDSPSTVRKHAQPPPLLQVNRFLRAETLPIYYGQTDFQLEATCSITCIKDKRQLIGRYRKWLSSLSSEAVRNIRFVRFPDDPYRGGCRGLQISLRRDAQGGATARVWLPATHRAVFSLDWYPLPVDWVGTRLVERLEAKLATIVMRKRKGSWKGLTRKEWVDVISMFYMACGRCW